MLFGVFIPCYPAKRVHDNKNAENGNERNIFPACAEKGKRVRVLSQLVSSLCTRGKMLFALHFLPLLKFASRYGMLSLQQCSSRLARENAAFQNVVERAYHGATKQASPTQSGVGHVSFGQHAASLVIPLSGLMHVMGMPSVPSGTKL